MQELTDKQKQLLQLYHDGCCAWYKRPQLMLLLACNPAALQYLNSLRELKTKLQKDFAARVTETATVDDMWEKIERRIEAEEKAAFYLERHHPKAERRSNIYGIFGSLSVAAMATLVIFANNGQRNAKPLELIQDVDAPVVQQAAFDSRPRIVEEPAVEMNWLKSAGSVSLIRDSAKDGSSVIWVRRHRRPLRVKKLEKSVENKSK